MSDPISQREAVTSLLADKLIPKNFRDREENVFAVLMMDGLRGVTEDIFRIVEGAAEDEIS